ncbi:MAG: hypothetical protein QM535_14965 [Limnohabitans sp.]|nr:hypothetical protein [Limnohabitans sp.]
MKKITLTLSELNASIFLTIKYSFNNKKQYEYKSKSENRIYPSLNAVIDHIPSDVQTNLEESLNILPSLVFIHFASGKIECLNNLSVSKTIKQSDSFDFSIQVAIISFVLNFENDPPIKVVLKNVNNNESKNNFFNLFFDQRDTITAMLTENTPIKHKSHESINKVYEGVIFNENEMVVLKNFFGLPNAPEINDISMDVTKNEYSNEQSGSNLIENEMKEEKNLEKLVSQMDLYKFGIQVWNQKKMLIFGEDIAIHVKRLKDDLTNRFSSKRKILLEENDFFNVQNMIVANNDRPSNSQSFAPIFAPSLWSVNSQVGDLMKDDRNKVFSVDINCHIENSLKLSPRTNGFIFLNQESELRSRLNAQHNLCIHQVNGDSFLSPNIMFEKQTSSRRKYYDENGIEVYSPFKCGLGLLIYYDHVDPILYVSVHASKKIGQYSTDKSNIVTFEKYANLVSIKEKELSKELNKDKEPSKSINKEKDSHLYSQVGSSGVYFYREEHPIFTSRVIKNTLFEPLHQSSGVRQIAFFPFISRDIFNEGKNLDVNEFIIKFGFGFNQDEMKISRVIIKRSALIEMTCNLNENIESEQKKSIYCKI